MQELKFSISIKASKERVWHILWDDQTFRDWANIIDEGTYRVGEMKKGNHVQYISSVNGYGVTSEIVELVPFEMVILNHMKDTKESGTQEREDEWTGGTESYFLTEFEDFTTLTVQMDVPNELEDIMNSRFPRALDHVKTLSETTEEYNRF